MENKGLTLALWPCKALESPAPQSLWTVALTLRFLSDRPSQCRWPKSSAQGWAPLEVSRGGSSAPSRSAQGTPKAHGAVEGLLSHHIPWRGGVHVTSPWISGAAGDSVKQYRVVWVTPRGVWDSVTEDHTASCWLFNMLLKHSLSEASYPDLQNWGHEQGTNRCSGRWSQLSLAPDRWVEDPQPPLSPPKFWVFLTEAPNIMELRQAMPTGSWSTKRVSTTKGWLFVLLGFWWVIGQEEHLQLQVWSVSSPDKHLPRAYYVWRPVLRYKY